MSAPLQLRQLDERLKGLAPLVALQRPPRGWIRAIRESLGMSGRHLAERMGVKPPRVVELEQSEKLGKVTVESLRRAAEAMDCVFVYGLVPRTSLEEMLRRQARLVASQDWQRVSHTMLLEGQNLEVREADEALEEQVEALVVKRPRWMWDRK